MRRRALFIVAGLVLPASLIWLFFVGPFGDRPGERKEPRAPVPVAAQQAERPSRPLPARGSGLRGGVFLEGGAPATGAFVRLLWDGGSKEVMAGEEGAFAFSGLPSGEYLVLASLGELASESLGPIPLGEGEELGGLALFLAQGAGLAGTIRDGSTGESLAGARVELSGQALLSDHAGRFRFVGLSPGSSTLIASAAGYETRIQAIQIHPGTASGLELRLDKGAVVEGTVVDADGRAAPGATVSASRYRLGGAPAPSARVISDSSGRFRLVAPVGQVEVSAIAPSGAMARSGPLELAPGSTRTDLVLGLEPLSQVFGQVVDGMDGGPVAGAEVHLSDLEGRILGSTVSGRDGRFSFDTVPGGMVRLVAKRGMARGTAGPIGVGGGEGAPVILSLGGGALEGIVEDDRGQPLRGVRVSVWPEGSPKELAVATTTSSGGTFLLEGLPEGPLRIEAEGEGGKAERRGVFTGEEGLRLILGGGRLVGRVLIDDRPGTDFQILVAPLEPGGGGARNERFVSTDGSFSMELPMGRYEIRATAPGAGLGRQVAEVPSRGDSMEALVELSSGGIVEGVVLSEATGEPIPGVRVSIYRGGTWAFGQGSPTAAAFSSITDGAGRFRLTGVPAGRMPIFAWKPGLKAARPTLVEVETGGTATAEVRVHEGDDEGGQSAFGGIGMTLMPMGGGVGVAWVIEGGPAWEAGVRRGDRIVAIDGTPTTDVGGAVGKVRGPVGTAVVLSLVRGDVPFRAVALRTEVRF